MKRNRFLIGRRCAVVLAALAVVTLVAGCGASSSAGGGSGDVDRDAAFRISYPVAQSLDPRQAPEPAQMLISTWPVYDRLIQVSAESTYEPMLATDWEASKDGRALTLQLRQDVTFSDGTAFDATAVKANIEWGQQAKDAILSENLSGISKVKVVDEHTVELALVEPSTTVLAALSSTLGGTMISPQALSNDDLAANPVGTGAYEVESFQPGQEVTYTRRTDGEIWDEETGGPAKVQINTMDADAQVSSVKSGQIDLTVWSQSTEQFQTELDSEQLNFTVMDGVLNMVGMYFNRTTEPFDDPRVRQAVNHAIDREAIVEAFMPSTAPRVQPWPEGLAGFDESREDAYAHDPEQARKLLAEAGYADGLDAGEMLVGQAGALPKAAQTIQANLAEVGIDIELRNMDIYSIVSNWPRSGASSMIQYMSLPSIDPYSWLDRLFVNPTWTIGGADQELVQMVEGTDDLTMSEEERARQVGKVVQLATENAYYAPLWQGVGGFVSTPQVQNLDPLASTFGGVADFRHVYLTE